MKQYPEYKESEIDWIGHIPINWVLKKIKHNTYVKGRIGWQGLKTDEYLTEGFAYLVTGTDFINGQINWKSCFYIDLSRYNEDPHIQLKEGDLLITKDGTIGKVALVKNMDKPSTLNSGIFLVRPKNGNYTTIFLYWVLCSPVFSGFFEYHKSGSTIGHLYQNVFVEFCFPVPPIYIQTQIANFLNYKTRQIDDLIDKKQKLIELLKEERTAQINQAVTKGLDQTVPMKNSGIEWLSEIPEHWDRVQLKRIVSRKITDGPHETPDFFDAGIPFLSAEGIRGNRIDLNYVRGYISKEQYDIYRNKSEVRLHDILLCKSGSTTGKSAIVETNEVFAIWSPLAIIRANRNLILPYFIYYFLQSVTFTRQIEAFWSFGTQPNIGMDAIENLWLSLPSTKEQEKILSELDIKLNKIQGTIDQIENEIDLITEYRKSLINEAVTGKIDVRDYKISHA
jgi:type I restriction enzyme, S subunit